MRKAALLCMALVLTIVSSPVVRAEESLSSADLTEAQLATVARNCASVQSTLGRIYANDALNRVHLGQEYETIATKFMATMNSRAGLNRGDVSAMTATTATFNKKLDELRARYQSYKVTIESASRMQCSSTPSEFYDTLVTAQKNRAAVREVMLELNVLVGQYSSQVKELRAALKVDALRGSNS